MENQLNTPAPTIAAIPEAPPLVQPEKAAIPSENSNFQDIENNYVFGKAMPYIIAVGLGIVTSYYFMGIVYFSKALKNSNSIANLQNQLDQLKIAQSQQK